MAITAKFLAPGLMNKFRVALLGLLEHASCICAHLYKNLVKSFCSALGSVSGGSQSKVLFNLCTEIEDSEGNL
jgi:hypothetical protein